MDLGFHTKRVFGPAEHPLRRAVVQGISEASENGAVDGDELVNPFDVDTDLMGEWIPGIATITSVVRTDEWIGRNEFFEVTLVVEVDSIEPYELAQRQLIPERAQFEWQPGVEVGILVNPFDRSKAVLT